MNALDELIDRSIYLIREAHASTRRIALLWSMGKDSTALLWLCRQAFLGRLPFPVIHIDTSYKFPEIYRFRDELTRAWGFADNLIVVRNEPALAAGMSNQSKFECCTALKTNALRDAMGAGQFEALLLGIRRDEHGIRAKERYFSPRDGEFRWNYRDQPMELWDQCHRRDAGDMHYRVHPLLHWSELDVWELIRARQIPTVGLYFARDGRRYRSIGCQCCCEPVESTAANVDEVIRELRSTRLAERAGRSQDKESPQIMQKLRALGYM